jgi:hypothetical protein
MRYASLLPIFTAFLALTVPISAAKQPKNSKNAILLSNVQSLTLRADAKTAHRRLPPVPQYAPPYRATAPSYLIEMLTMDSPLG